MPDGSDSNEPVREDSTLEAALSAALGEGDPQKVQALIEAGADIRYKREHGYDALVDAVHGRDVVRDPRLLELLALLAAHGADLSGITSYGESGLRVLSRLGRFDGVRVLLDAGAADSQLEWTPLIKAVALGSLADVQAALEAGAALEDRDWWGRTAWLVALLIGDIDKAKMLQARGADTAACGHWDCPLLFYAIQGHHADLVRWLIQEGADIHQTDRSGTTTLIEAVEADDLECVEILLQEGAAVEPNPHGTALNKAASRAVVMRLLEAGADPADADQRIIMGLQATADEALAGVSPDEFRRAFTRRFGVSNPERMNVPFWEAMIRCGVAAYEARRRFQVERGDLAEPVWCAERFGQSLTLLPDGRAIQIGGEHEDFYDPDFCIYNDVFVHERDGSVAIYGYPDSVFPPTDFHTATLVGDFIYVIGSLAYQGTRRFEETPVYRLNIHTLRMDRLNTSGTAPGWIYKHRAVAVHAHAIRVWGGQVATQSGDKESHSQNSECFVLDLERLCWHRESNSDRAAGSGGPTRPADE